jgi:hypothetical protein
MEREHGLVKSVKAELRLNRRVVSVQSRQVESSGMRRNAIAVVLFALALGLKVLLPAAAVANASHAHIPQTAFQDCLSAAEDGPFGQAPTPGKADRHAASCPLCQISCEGGFALLERASQPDSLIFFDRAAPWRDADGAEPRARLSVTHQARAPPRAS